MINSVPVYVNEQRETGLVFKFGDTEYLFDGKGGFFVVEDSGCSQITLSAVTAEHLNLKIEPVDISVNTASFGDAVKIIGVAREDSQGRPLTVGRCLGTDMAVETHTEVFVMEGTSKMILMGGIE